jgi:2-methylcitrate dehydratase PrpD
LAPVSIGENLWGGYTIKIVHGGQAARMGIEAAHWAQLGFSGCPLEGSPQRARGLCAVVSDDPDYNEMTGGLGERYTILDIYPKPYAACRVTHASADATLYLIKEHDLKPEDVESVLVTTYEYAAQTVGASYPDGTDNFLKCQFSIPYVVAACILEGAVGLPQFTADKIKSPRFMAMSRKVKVAGDAQMSQAWPASRPSLVEIRTIDGRTLAKRVDYPLGDPRNPFTPEMFDKKIEQLISFGLGENRTPEIKRKVQELDAAPDVKGLLASLE